MDLGHSSGHIVGFRIAHGLDGHGGTAAHSHLANHQFLCHIDRLLYQFEYILECYQQHKAHQQDKARRVDGRLIFLRYLPLEQCHGNCVHQQEKDPSAIQRR